MKTERHVCVLLRTVRWLLAPVGLALLLVACVSSGDKAQTASPAQQVVRKNIKALTAEEKADFVEAVLRLKKLPPPNGDLVGNWYDHFVAVHMRKLVCWTDILDLGGYGHNGPDILTWHRAFLLDFEAAMSKVMGKPMAIPYWDWTDPSSTPVLFSDTFMGGKGDASQGYVVTTGPFRAGEWRINVKGAVSTNPGRFDWLVRAVGNMPGMRQLPSSAEVQQAMLRPVYDTAPWNVKSDLDRSFRAFVDGSVGAAGIKCDGGVIVIDGAQTSLVHGTVHMWVGGVDDKGNPGGLTDTATSPNDPIFWLHHSNVDRLLESWWRLHAYQYQPVSGGPRGANVNDLVWPYNQTNGDMAVPSATLGYVYDELITIETGARFMPAAQWVKVRGAFDLCTSDNTLTP